MAPGTRFWYFRTNTTVFRRESPVPALCTVPWPAIHLIHLNKERKTEASGKEKVCTASLWALLLALLIFFYSLGLHVALSQEKFSTKKKLLLFPFIALSLVVSDQHVHKCSADSAMWVSMMIGTMLTVQLIQREREWMFQLKMGTYTCKRKWYTALTSFSIHIRFSKNHLTDCPALSRRKDVKL